VSESVINGTQNWGLARHTREKPAPVAYTASLSMQFQDVRLLSLQSMGIEACFADHPFSREMA
jgi:hypothetical protein